MPSELLVGDPAPDFHAIAVGGDYPPEGQPVHLTDLRGRRAVLSFYPSNDAPGAVVHLRAIRDAWEALRGRTAVFGVNHERPEDHRRTVKQLALPFALLSDEGHHVARVFGLWFGEQGAGDVEGGESTARATFILDGKGCVEAIWREADPGTHAAWLLKTLGN